MVLSKWRGQTATLEMSGGSLPTDPIGVLQEVTISPTQDVSELRGAGDVRWVDIMRTSVGVEITGTVAAWDAEAWDRLVDYDDAAGGFSPDADVPTFTTTVELTNSDGGVKEITAEPGYMDPPPELSGDRESWIEMDISVTAKEISNISNPA